MTELLKIKKRDGRVVGFDEKKIGRAILKALTATKKKKGKKLKKEAERLAKIVVNILKKSLNGEMPTVEQVQDIVEQVLMAGGHYETAKNYILYREKHKSEREARQLVGVEDDLGLSLNQLKVLKNRYLRHDEIGQVQETPRELFIRVAEFAAKREKKKKEWQEKFFKVISQMEFMPAGGYLRSAGTRRPTLANCFVLPVEDDMKEIFEAVKWLALVQQAGGGTGFNFSKLRPKGDYVKSSGGFATGPVSFMKVFDAATAQVMQGGYRMGANMGILDVNHPDILDFINCKTEEGEIENFNISVGASDSFMKAVKKNKNFDLINPRNGEVVQTVKAKELFLQIITLAWKTGDPGMIFLDRINRDNPVKEKLGLLKSTNPCGEQPLHPFDVCNLGSINLAKMTADKKVNWKRLERVVRIAVRFLDNGVDLSRYPIRQITKMAKNNRRIGLGIMGFADLLYDLKISYKSDEAVKLAEKLMKFINETAVEESKKLAKEKGVFKNWKGSEFEKKGIKRRNLAVTTIAPTGTISMVADCSSGIEPVFGLSFRKNVVDEKGLEYVNKYFKKAIEESNLTDDQKNKVFKRVLLTGSCQDIEYLPLSIKKVFVTAYDIKPEEHVKMQAGWQKFTENAVSKTINFPKTASIAEVEKAYMTAWENGCKGITVYRSGSKDSQVLERLNPAEKGQRQIKKKKNLIQSKVRVKPLAVKIRENGDKCPECGAVIEMNEGCMTCRQCGFSKCSL